MAKRPATPKPARDEKRVASQKKRDPFSSLGTKGRLRNIDPTLLKFAPGEGITLYDRAKHQFAGLFGHCQAWVDHILANEIVIKPAKAPNPEDQEIANAAADRATRAWERVRNRAIVLQKLLWGRFYGFARAEKVWRFEPILGEWIQDLYDVPQKFWQFDDDGREFLVSASNYNGEEVDPSRFLHFQWGSADSKYGEGDLSKCYLSLYKMQQYEDQAARRIEDNESKIHIRVPRSYSVEEHDAAVAGFEEHYNIVMTTVYDGDKVEVDDNNAALVSSGATARPENEQIQWHWTQVQVALLGAPQTGTKQLGTGKVEETRSAVWDDKTPLGLAALDQCLTAGWLDAYFDMNMPSLPVELRPKFDSATSDLQAGLSGAAAAEFRNFGMDLIARRITLTMAVEGWIGLGISRPRALAMAESAIKEREELAKASADSTIPETAAETAGQGQQEAA